MNLEQKLQWLITSSSVPPEMGESPIPHGMMRRFHVTKDEESAKDIEKNGLTISHAKGIEGPRAIYSWPDAKSAKDYSHGHGPVIEFHHHPKHYEAHPYATHAEVPASHIVAIHHPWHEHYRYIKEHKVPMKNVERVKDDPYYSKAYNQLKAEGYK